MTKEVLEVVKTRNNFYRDGYRRLVILLFISFIANVALAAIVFLLYTTEPTPKYFATTDSGRIIPLIPLNQPNVTNKAILQWAAQAVVSVYTYDFVHYRQTFQENQKYFTSKGWQGFLNAVASSRDLQTVRARKLVLSAVISSAPIITSEYIQNGRYTWKVQVPIMVTYQSLSETFHQNLLVTLTVRRISTLDNAVGIGISSFVAQAQ